MNSHTEPQSAITQRLNVIKSTGVTYGLDLSTVDNVIRVNYSSRIATGSLDTDSLEQTIVEELPYEQTSSHSGFAIYSRTDDRDQTIALGGETAISSTEYDRQKSTIESIIDTKFGDQLNALQTDGPLKSVADGTGHTYHGTKFSEPGDDSYELETVPEKMGRLRRLTDGHGYLIHQAAFSKGAEQSDIEEFASELDTRASGQDVETTNTIENVSGYPSLRHYTRVSRKRALESVEVQPLPNIAFRVEESSEAVTITHEYGDTVDAGTLSLEGYLSDSKKSVLYETQPSDTYNRFGQGASLRLSKRVNRESVSSMLLRYTETESTFNNLFAYSPRME